MSGKAAEIIVCSAGAVVAVVVLVVVIMLYKKMGSQGMMGKKKRRQGWGNGMGGGTLQMYDNSDQGFSGPGGPGACGQSEGLDIGEATQPPVVVSGEFANDPNIGTVVLTNCQVSCIDPNDPYAWLVQQAGTVSSPYQSPASPAANSTAAAASSSPPPSPSSGAATGSPSASSGASSASGAASQGFRWKKGKQGFWKGVSGNRRCSRRRQALVVLPGGKKRRQGLLTQGGQIATYQDNYLNMTGIAGPATTQM